MDGGGSIRFCHVYGGRAARVKASLGNFTKCYEMVAE